MEPLGAFPHGEWDSISRLLFAEDFDEGLNFASSLWFSDEASNANVGEIYESQFFAEDYLNSKNLFNQENNGSSGDDYSSTSVFLPNQSQDDAAAYNCIGGSDTFDMTHMSMMDQTTISSFFVPRDHVKLDVGHAGEEAVVPGTKSYLKRKCNAHDMLEHKSRADDKKIHESPKKRTRVSKAHSLNKTVQSKKTQKLATVVLDDAEDDNVGRTASPYSSEDDSNASLENSDSKVPATINLNGKKAKASKASIAESQSVYARKRREKINERLKTLQHLVPNGTKVDISTMLEEAVHYVKFLQVQIKLLSSDDHWMYAPLAYNGMDIGSILRTISPTL